MLVFTTKLSLNCQCNAAQSCDLHVSSSLRSLTYGMGSDAPGNDLGSQQTPAGSVSPLVTQLTSSSSCFCQHANISDMLHPILTSLGPNSKWVNAHLWHDQFGVKGHVGFTGVKKIIFTKKCYFSRLLCMALWLIRIHHLNTPFKSYQLIFKIWGHRGQKVIFTKNAITPSYYIAWP